MRRHESRAALDDPAANGSRLGGRNAPLAGMTAMPKKKPAGSLRRAFLLSFEKP